MCITMAITGLRARLVICIVILQCITTWETSSLPVYTSVLGNGIDALIVSNEQVYLQRSQTQRIPCGKEADGTTDVIAATWYKGDTKNDAVIRIVLNPIHWENYTSPDYEGRASFTEGFDLTLRDVIQGDTGRYTCEIITSSDRVDYEVEVVVIDENLPKRPAVRSVELLLRAGEGVIDCPVYNKSITRPTIYYSLQRDDRLPRTFILVSRFSDGSVLRKDPTFDIQREANYSLLIKEPDAHHGELLIWCHVSSVVDGVNLMSGFVNVTLYKPSEPPILVWIVPVAFSGVLVLFLFPAAVCLKRHLATQSSSTDTEETIPINRGPINNESCKDYKLKKVIQTLRKKEKASENKPFSSLRLVAVAGNGDLVMLDNEAIRVMSKKYVKKTTFKMWQSLLDEYVAIATSKRQDGEVLVARKGGKISWRNNKDGKEVEIDGSRYQTPVEISDMDVDDVGTIYVADIVRNMIFTYNLNGSFKASFTVGGSPKCISACEDGILYVLSGTRNERDKGFDIEGGTIKKYINFSRADYDVKWPTGENNVTTGLYSSKTSLYVLTKKAGSDEEASAILEFSSTGGDLQRRIIGDWTGILGIVFIREDDELAFFDSKEAKVYERLKPKKRWREISLQKE